MTIDLDRYFRRIGLAGAAQADLRTLRSLHASHAAAIPFENLSAFLGEPVPLDVPSLEAKLLTPGRGGWCFEQNLYFSHALEAMGFTITRLAARVRWNVPAHVTTARSHMLLLADVDGERYIADVGFGGLTLTAPLRLEPGVEQATAHEPHRLLFEDAKYSLQARISGEWRTLYVFDLTPQEIADYEVSNWYLCNHPQSQFLTGLVCARAAPDRRHALRNSRYAVHYPDGRTERRFIESVDELKAILRDSFEIAVPGTPRFDEKAAAMIAVNP